MEETEEYSHQDLEHTSAGVCATMGLSKVRVEISRIISPATEMKIDTEVFIASSQLKTSVHLLSRTRIHI